MSYTQDDINNGRVCPYCFKRSVYVDSSEVYNKSYGMIYLCRSCKAWVGVHKGTSKALGRLANSELREWKKEAHFHFDKLWQAKIKKGFSKNKARGFAYKWLAAQLGITPTETHVGWFDVDMCKKVVEICKPYADKL